MITISPTDSPSFAEMAKEMSPNAIPKSGLEMAERNSVVLEIPTRIVTGGVQ